MADHSLSDMPGMRQANSLVDQALNRVASAAHFVRIARSSHDLERACSYRSQVMWEEARHRGIDMEQLVMLSFPSEFYRARINGSWQYFQSLPIPAKLAADMYQGIDDKYRLKQFLSSQGIPVSRARLARTLPEAERALAALTAPLVVKPRIGSRARHTTTNIRSLEHLTAAFHLAKELCRDVLIEEHLEGAVSRATVVGDRLVGFLQMFQVDLVGDGVHSIEELVAQKNASRPERVAEIVLDDEHRAYLARSGYTPASIVPAGTLVELSRRTGRFEGGRTREMPEAIHPKLRAYIERAAKLLKVPVVGFDIIIPDPEQDPDHQRWGVLEANSLPYIDLHHAPLEGEPSNVAGAVWDLWKREA